MPTLKKKGDAVVISAHKNEPVNIRISGTKGTVALQKENSAPGSGSWRNLMSWTLNKGNKQDKIESSYSEPHDELINLRLILKSGGEKTSVNAEIEIPAEEKNDEEPQLREKVEGEFVESTQEDEDDDVLVRRSSIGEPAGNAPGSGESGATSTARAPNAPLSQSSNTQTKK